MPWISETGLWGSFAIFALIVLADLWAIMRVRKSKTGSSNKALWIIGIVAVPVVGVLAWIVAGPQHSETARH